MLLRLISLVLFPVAVSQLFGPNCGCIRPIVFELPTPPKDDPTPCPGTCNPCGRKKRQISVVPEPVNSEDRKCNNEQLREIILNALERNPSQAKSVIHSEVQAILDGNWVVMCAQKPVSFITQSQRYCMDGHNGTWCYAFQSDYWL
ncbi:ground-like domain protein [Cooperia oncophora]